MTIDEAIEMLGFVIEDKRYSEGEPGYDAIKLGIEALKGIEAVRQLHPELSPFPLPGETKD